MAGSYPARELKALKARLEAAASPALRREYKNTIAHVKRHADMMAALNEQRELIGLRLDNALLSLTQLRMEMTRMKAITGTVASAQVKKLKQTASELSEYLIELEKAQIELDL
jgi:hypothetical protein